MRYSIEAARDVVPGFLFHVTALAVLLALALCAPAQDPVIYTSDNPTQLYRFGSGVTSLGDITGDGIDDVVIGAETEFDFDLDILPGKAYIINGETAEVIHVLNSPNPENSGSFGLTLKSAGDLNNDSVNDVIVGAPNESPPGAFRGGYIYAFSGADGANIWESSSPAAEEFGNFGASIATAGDITGDGKFDFIVGSPGEQSDAGDLDAGRVYAISGANGNDFAVLNSPNSTTDGEFGYAVSGIRDVTGDGKADFLVGAIGEKHPTIAGSDYGLAYLFASSGGLLLQTFLPPTPETFSKFGGSISAIADITDDGLDDVVVGAFEQDFGDISDAGAVYVFDSDTGALIHDIASPDATESGQFGFRVKGIPDIDGNSLPEIVVAAPAELTSFPHKAGRVHLFDGDSGLLIASAISPDQSTSGRFGSDLDIVRDADGSGTEALLIGAEHEGFPDYVQGGRAYRMFPDLSAPTVALSTEVGLATNTSPVALTATFNENVSGFELGDIAVTNGTVDNFAMIDGANYTFDATPDAEGPVTVSIPGGAAVSGGGAPNLPASPVGFDYDITPPSLLIRLPEPSVTTTGPAAFEVLYSNADTVLLAPEMVTLVQSNGGNVNGTFSVEMINAIRYNVILSNITGNGRVNIALAEGTAADNAGNLAPALTGNLSLLVEGNLEAEESETHTADQDTDNIISLSELLRVIQFFNSTGLSCADPPASTEDGYQPGPGDTSCTPHSSDYATQDWTINLSELLRLIQFFNTGGYTWCPDETPPTEDGYCPQSTDSG